MAARLLTLSGGRLEMSTPGQRTQGRACWQARVKNGFVLSGGTLLPEAEAQEEEIPGTPQPWGPGRSKIYLWWPQIVSSESSSTSA